LLFFGGAATGVLHGRHSDFYETATIRSVLLLDMSAGEPHPFIRKMGSSKRSAGNHSWTVPTFVYDSCRHLALPLYIPNGQSDGVRNQTVHVEPEGDSSASA